MTRPAFAMDRGAKPKHLLHALLFLTKCSDEKSHCAIVNVKDPKTFRCWCWEFIEAMFNLEKKLIKWNNRFKWPLGEVDQKHEQGGGRAVKRRKTHPLGRDKMGPHTRGEVRREKITKLGGRKGMVT